MFVASTSMASNWFASSLFSLSALYFITTMGFSLAARTQNRQVLNAGRRVWMLRLWSFQLQRQSQLIKQRLIAKSEELVAYIQKFQQVRGFASMMALSTLSMRNDTVAADASLTPLC
jgi:hypothetical protein